MVESPFDKSLSSVEGKVVGILDRTINCILRCANSHVCSIKKGERIEIDLPATNSLSQSNTNLIKVMLSSNTSLSEVSSRTITRVI